MTRIDFYFFYVSSYYFILFLAFLFNFIIFYILSKNKLEKIDYLGLFIINILGFAIGSKILSLFDNHLNFTITNFLNSGYTFTGGIVGSIILIFIYCKRYELNFSEIIKYFYIIYPNIYAFCKIGCFINNCCGGKFRIQIIEAIFMFILFLILLLNKNKNIIPVFFLFYGIIRFISDYYRNIRNIFILNLTSTQIICICFICIAIYLFIKKK